MTKQLINVIKNIYGKLNSASHENRVSDVKKKIVENKLTYLSDAKLDMLISICLSNEANNIPGIIVETGCALGGSSILMASVKDKKRALRVYDVFGMIPPPSDKDGKDVHERYNVIGSGKSKGIRGDNYYGYEEDLYNKVISSFNDYGYQIESNNIQLIKGLLQDTLKINEPISLAHIDVDWYEPVYISLERIEPYISIGGAIVLDDYFDWSGCREATDEYFKDKKDQFSFNSSSESMVIVTQVSEFKSTILR